MVLARYRIERYGSRWEHLADTHLAAVPERGAMLTYHVFAKPRSLLDAEDASDGTGGCTDGSADYRPERSSCSVASSRTLFGSPDRSLCVRRIRQCCDEESGNRKQ